MPPIISILIAFVIVIFVLVTVHEFGHFISARIFGMHVPVFSVGMGRRLFGFNKINGFTLGPLPEPIESQLGANTDYRISILPLGGYAKIDGMIDETQIGELSTDIKPWEFRAKPWWQKSIVISAGVIMNILLAAGIFMGLRYAEGEEIINTTEIGYVNIHSLSRELGVEKGDRVIAVNNKQVKNWNEVREETMLNNMARDFTMTVERTTPTGIHEQKQFLYKAHELGNVANDQDKFFERFGLWPIGYGAARIEEVVASRPAERLGLQKGDVITAVNGDQVDNERALIDHISAHPNEEITIEWMRPSATKGAPSQMMSGKIKPDADGKIGVNLMGTPYNGPVLHESYGFLQSAKLGWTDMVDNLSLLAKNIAMIFTGKVAAKKALGGPIKIAQAAGEQAALGLSPFVRFMALLSISLAFLNILPVPALDGGHLVIILIEAALGHELSQRFKLGFQKVGVALLLGLMVFMVFNDLHVF